MMDTNLFYPSNFNFVLDMIGVKRLKYEVFQEEGTQRAGPLRPSYFLHKSLYQDRLKILVVLCFCRPGQFPIYRSQR
jgi:hypothetical protein